MIKFSIQQISDVTNLPALRNIVNILVRQVSDNTGEVYFRVGSEMTPINDAKIINESKILLIPRNENAKDNKYYISEVGSGYAEIHHDLALENTVFDYVILGSR